MDWHMARAALEWQAELGVVDAIGDAPIDRYAVPAEKPKSMAVTVVSAPPVMAAVALDPIAIAEKSAAEVQDLAELKQALHDFPHCELKRGARNLVFSDGTPGARVMILGEAPGREEDLHGEPFVGPAGLLLDKMLAAIGLNRAHNVYFGSVIPWRPPQNREPKAEEVAMMMPFVRRHVALAAPDVLICMGNTSCLAILDKRCVSELRGQWHEGLGLPVLPMVHPSNLLRHPAGKKQAWQDFLVLKAWLHEHAAGEL
jgi:uracil-DNA glycosylase family 4